MDVFLQDLVITSIEVLGVVNLLIILVAVLHRAYSSFIMEHSVRSQEELWPRVESYLQSASKARHIPTLDVRPGERQHVFDVLLSYAGYYNLDLHDIFDINGFTRERIETLWTRKNPQLLRELSVIKSPQAQDLLFARLAETSGEEAYRVAYALAAVNLSEPNQRRLVKTMLKAGINTERSVEILASLGMPANMLLEMLYEQDGSYGEKILLSTLAYGDNLDQNWIAEDVRPYLFHSKEVAMAAIDVLGSCGTSYAYDMLRDEYYNNPSWEVRACIVRAMKHFEPYYAIPLLKIMAGDEVWWVQFNALSVLSGMGPQGQDAIRKLAADSSNPAAAKLARQVVEDTGGYGKRLQPAFEPAALFAEVSAEKPVVAAAETPPATPAESAGTTPDKLAKTQNEQNKSTEVPGEPEAETIAAEQEQVQEQKQEQEKDESESGQESAAIEAREVQGEAPVNEDEDDDTGPEGPEEEVPDERHSH